MSLATGMFFYVYCKKYLLNLQWPTSKDLSVFNPVLTLPFPITAIHT